MQLKEDRRTVVDVDELRAGRPMEYVADCSGETERMDYVGYCDVGVRPWMFGKSTSGWD